jgi:hypothetical protein
MKMSQETCEIVTKKEIGGIEMQLALQCAPLITGLKISNLLNISREHFIPMQEIVKDSDISWYVFLESKEKLTVLLYQRESMENYLRQPEVRGLLEKAGYQSLLHEYILETFSERYRRYMKTKKDFPHEMGLLLGYPAEDVEGFIKNQGSHSLYAGYWKVYANKERKIKLFESFENAKESLIQLLSCGISMASIMDVYCNRTEIGAVQINY